MSVFANLFRIYAYSDVTRLIFTDCTEGKEGVIVANVVMRTEDAAELAEKLRETIKRRPK